MENKILRFIQQHELVKAGETVLVGLSGGADSTALSLVLKNLGFVIEAAHCNFHLRGEESDRDEAFVREFCREQNLSLTVTHFKTEEYAKKKKISIEMAARELRYDFFQKLMKSANIEKLAVAHHQNDQAETVLLNLIRGTGIHGLRGMLPQNGNVIRPLLCVSREEILDYLIKKQQSFVEDSTNLCTDYTRNKIRLELLPFLKELNPSIIQGLNHTASVLNDVEQVYNEHINQQLCKIILTKDFVLGMTPIILKRNASPMKSIKNNALWHEMLSPYGFNESQIKDLLELDTNTCGRVFYSKKWRLYVDRDLIAIKENHILDKQSKIINQSDTYIELNKVKIQIEELLHIDYPSIEKDSTIALFDADKITFPLILRQTEKGDTLKPFGMRGKKLVSDLLTDKKVPIWEKAEQLVLCDSEGEILWLVGRRTSANHAISEQTKRILRLKLLN